MKRLKQLLVIGLSLVMVFMFAACDSCSDDTQGTATLTSISVDYSAAQTEFYVYEDFTSDGIAVTATYSDGSTATLTSDQYTVDSSAYNKAARGTYTITVSYEGQSATYDVTNAYGTVSSFEINTANVKTLYYLGNSLDTTGLTATAVINGNTMDVTSYLSIDKSTFVGSTAGDYTINVLLYYGSSFKSGSYTVTVTDQVPMAGIDILVGDAITTELDVPITGESVTLSTDLISGVQLHEILYGQGTVTTALSSSDYTVEFYKETADGVAQISGSDLAVSSGTYQLWVKYNYTDPAYGSVYTLASFVLITIVNPVTAIALDDTNTSAVYTQSAGSDKISSTWSYVVTYSNGSTATVNSSDVTVTIDTKTVSESSTATVSYTEAGVTVTCDVIYSITAAEKQEGAYTMTYAATADSFATTWSGDEDTEGTVTISDSGISTWKDSSKSTAEGDVTYQYAVETKAYSSKAFKVNVAEGATNVSITVYFSHTSKASRTLYLGTEADSTTNGVIDSLAIGTADASPSILYTISGSGLSSGDYYIYSDSSTIHVYAIVVTYTLG